MKFINLLVFSVSISAFIACGHGRPADETTTQVTDTSIVPSTSTTPPQGTPVTLDANPSSATPALGTPTSATAPGMNPAHGEPGHRCDIAVGAPLNSAPTQPTTPATITTPATTPVTTPVNISSDKLTTPATTTKVAPGMNPAHGEPGHRCDIAVGAPLNSAPTQSTTPAVTTPATTPVTTPVNISTDKPAQPAAKTKVAPGMNPAHGEPGHRCDIAVGAPLDSKPTVVQGVPSKETVTSSSIPAVVPVKPVLDTSKHRR